MKISELFDLKQGNSFELINMNEVKNGQINFVSRTSNNNGVVATVEKIDAIKPFKEGLLTVALGGSVLSTFVQTKPFYTGFHVMVLEPKRKMTFNEKMYYAICIKKNAYRYGYGRQANKTLKDIEIPDRVPEWVNKYETDYSILKTKNKNMNINLDVHKWKSFKLKEIFEFKRGKRITKEFSEENKGTIPVIAGGENSQGILCYLDKKLKDEYVYMNKCFTVSAYGTARMCALS